LLNLFKTHKHNRIGIDIGSSSVKAIELSRSDKESLQIKGIGFAAIEQPPTTKNIVAAIKEATRKISTLNREVNVAVSGPSVVVRFIELPRMTEDELRNAIPFEAEKYIPFGITEVAIDHQLLIPRLGNNQMLILLVAVKKDLVNRRLELIREAGLNAGILDIASLANVNAFLYGTGRKEEGIVALIDIGANAMDINIIDHGLLYFTRNIQIGGSDITKAMCESMSLNYADAEKIKLDPSDKASEVREKIEPVLRTMADEARLSFSYYENQSGKSIEKIYLGGGGARTISLRALFKENFGIDVIPWNPAEFIHTHSSIDAKVINSIKDLLGVAIGLALR